MGISFRKSIKIGNNTRINLSSKGGLGISTGVKGARISTNKQGTRIYGSVGPMRYQKKISKASNISKISNIETVNESQTNTNMKETTTESNKKGFKKFFKKYYKQIIIAIIGLMIGSLIGGIGRISNAEVEQVKKEIETNNSIIRKKESELNSILSQNEKLRN
ncbi:DUF4236 domain-containing protein [Clostridium sp. DSM 100503]|uniref:DUF4236 domain-containing protein n=1 Tax=Clostridium sp. DSM 100503 TaxID=2963282 RepID=UPI002149D452|nr:DUF4236 domain-containing protein [Clostridium sp. DSM 100503]MCR1953184.1 DUF4236 domain-containing protein [Clostridium sp. DSM 100503]